MRKLAMIAATALTIGGLGTSALTSAQASAPPAPARKAMHCTVVLKKPRPGQASSPVVSQTCGDTKKDLRALDDTLLITLYQHADYGGASLEVKGQDGPCDKAGYKFPVVPWPWFEMVSSFRATNDCHWTSAWSEFNFGGGTDGWYAQNVPYVGIFLNDNFRSFTIRGLP
ncbi:hypothetical protein [Actinomadura roseirufa]|uniref:hypothetical protein n=1 Tax=Actinomadura roseirufa TaxID=2094049 RepID=UPI00104154DA|nr:hypothetical protein [Actinomadura roseirufa]